MRDRERNLKPWLDHFFRITRQQANLRILYVSERRLADEEVGSRSNLAQFSVEQLTDVDIQVLLADLIDPRFFDARKIEALAGLVLGHPATAHFVARLVNSERNPDTLNANPAPVVAFQNRTLDAIMSGDALSHIQKQIIALLGIFPKLSFRMLAQVLEVPKKDLAEELWDLIDFSLLQSVDSEYFSCPDIVSTRSRQDLGHMSAPLLQEVKEKIEADVAAGEMESQLVDALLIAAVEASGEIPADLRGIVTSSSLLAIVTSQFQQARSIKGSNKLAYERVYRIAKLAMGMRVSDDAIEQNSIYRRR